MENETSGSNRLRTTLRDAEEHFSSETEALQKHHEMQLSQANAEVSNVCFSLVLFSDLSFAERQTKGRKQGRAGIRAGRRSRTTNKGQTNPPPGEKGTLSLLIK